MKTGQRAFSPDPGTSAAASMPGRLAGQENAAAKLGTLMVIWNTPDSQAGLSSGLHGACEPHEIAQLFPASLHVSVVCALLLGSTRLVCASDPAGMAETLDNFNTLRDPTVLSSSVGLGYNHTDQHQDAFRSKLTLSGAYAFGAKNRRDWVVSAELPFIHDEPGNSGVSRASGVGDLKVGFGHVLDGTGRFRWGLGASGTFDTASKPQFGDGTVTLSPIWGGGFRFTPTFELVGNVQYNVSLYEASGHQPVHSLEISPALLKIWPHHWYSLAGWDSVLDFEDGKNHSGKVTAEIGKAFGVRQQWVLSTGVDVPVVRSEQDNFTVKAGINYVF